MSPRFKHLRLIPHMPTDTHHDTHTHHTHNRSSTRRLPYTCPTRTQSCAREADTQVRLLVRSTNTGRTLEVDIDLYHTHMFCFASYSTTRNRGAADRHSRRTVTTTLFHTTSPHVLQPTTARATPSPDATLAHPAHATSEHTVLPRFADAHLVAPHPRTYCKSKSPSPRPLVNAFPAQYHGERGRSSGSRSLPGAASR